MGTARKRCMPCLSSSTIRRVNNGRVFHVLRTNPGGSQRRLCELTRSDPSTVSAVISSLIEEELIRRSGSARNGPAPAARRLCSSGRREHSLCFGSLRAASNSACPETSDAEPIRPATGRAAWTTFPAQARRPRRGSKRRPVTATGTAASAKPAFPQHPCLNCSEGH